MIARKWLIASLFAAMLIPCALSGRTVADDGSAPKMHFSAKNPAETAAWQEKSRKLLFDLLQLADLQATRQEQGKAVPFDVKTLSTEDRGKYTWNEIEINSTPTRRIKAILTIPHAENKGEKFPAVVCIHGHGGHRKIVYDAKSLYRGFATKLAEEGYVTISTDVGQHKVYEEGRTLMGERLWDVLRCADYVASLPEVDANRMGCGGLSLGGEMAMWLGAMDPRMKATVSSGYLTTVANLKVGHCQCWDFPGFTENFEFSDIYSLIAPRALQSQIGEKERAPGGFPPALAREAQKDIDKAYAVANAAGEATLEIHPEGHVYIVPTGHDFFVKYLSKPQASDGN